MEHLGEKIKVMITDSGLKQKYVAESLGISTQHLHNLFRKESIETRYLYQFSEVLKVPLWTFFAESPLLVNQNKVYELENEIEIMKNTIREKSLFDILDALIACYNLLSKEQIELLKNYQK